MVIHMRQQDIIIIVMDVYLAESIKYLVQPVDGKLSLQNIVAALCVVVVSSMLYGLFSPSAVIRPPLTDIIC